jgi:putative hemolysin
MRRLRSITGVAALTAGLLAVAGAGCGGDETVAIANPASEFCVDQGGTLRIDTAADGGQVGICVLADGSEIEEWEYYRSQGGDSTLPGTTTPEGPEAYEVFLLSGGGDDCDAVVGVPMTSTVEGTLGEALTVLLAGPSQADLDAGLTSWFSDDTAGMLQSVVVQDGVAEVSFDAALRSTIPNASSSCGSAGLFAQLDGTVLQFDDVDRVQYSLDGDVDAFYEWLQMSAPTS